MVMHFVPYPPNTGALQRNFNLLREVSREHSVYLYALNQRVLFSDNQSYNEAITEVSKYCTKLKVFQIPSDRHKILWYLLLFLNLFSKKPYSCHRFYSRAMKKAISSKLRERSIEMVHVDTIDLAGYVDGFKDIPKVLNHHNVESKLLYRRAQGAGNPLVNYYLRMQAGRIQRYERCMIPQFQTNITVSSFDRGGIVEMVPESAVVVVPNGTDTDYFKPSDADQDCSIIFAGGFNWLPNKDAMLYFGTMIFPLILREIPEARMKIIGANPPKEMLKLATENPNLDILGFVPDIRDHFARAAVHVVPLRIGGGTRLKILDGLAMGKAIVSTTIGAEGLELVDGFDLVLADGEEMFAHKVVELLKNPQTRKILGRNGRLTVEKSYSWQVVGRTLLNCYRDICPK